MPASAAWWLDVVGFYAAWWGCAFAVRAGQEWLGVACCAAFVALHLALRPEDRGRLTSVVAASIVLGVVTDTALVRAGILSFGPDGWSRPWMAGLWAGFGATLTLSFAWVCGATLAVQAALGAIGGPFAYQAGHALGVLRVDGSIGAFLAIALAWAVAIPVLARVARALQGDPCPPGTKTGSQRDR